MKILTSKWFYLIFMLLFCFTLAVFVFLCVNEWRKKGGIRTECLDGVIICEENNVYIVFDWTKPLSPPRLIVEDKEFIEYAKVHNGEHIKCDVAYIQNGSVVSWKISKIYY